MSVDLNSIASKLKSRRRMGVTRDGELTEDNPGNDGSKVDKQGHTTLTPQRFYQG